MNFLCSRGFESLPACQYFQRVRRSFLGEGKLRSRIEPFGAAELEERKVRLVRDVPGGTSATAASEGRAQETGGEEQAGGGFGDQPVRHSERRAICQGFLLSGSQSVTPA